jgi:dTDP-4-dehydrorhamnose 3,5-epimerase/reductase
MADGYAAPMEIEVERGPLEDLYLIDLEVRADRDRPGGSFREVFQTEVFARAGLPPFKPIQWNISESSVGTLRGFHAEPWSKLVHVASGRVFAAIADIRRESPTAGQTWTGELDRSKALFIGNGLGNGFQAISDVAVYAYLVDGQWATSTVYPAVAWNDPDLAVPWPITDERLALSAKDRANPTLREHWGGG